jgi:transcriptional regulator with XRE-family HTH domain
VTSNKSLFGFTPKQRREYESRLLRLLVAADIENYLDNADLQAKDLAARVGKSKAWISKLLSGHQNATLDTLAEAAWALGARWRLVLTAAERAGTPAELDPPAPHWAQADQTTTQQVAPHYYLPLGAEALTTAPIYSQGLAGLAQGNDLLTAMTVASSRRVGVVWHQYVVEVKQSHASGESLTEAPTGTAPLINANTNTEMSWAQGSTGSA